MENIDHSRTKTKSPQTNGIVERFHKTILQEFYQVAFRKKLYRSIDEEYRSSLRLMAGRKRHYLWRTVDHEGEVLDSTSGWHKGKPHCSS